MFRVKTIENKQNCIELSSNNSKAIINLNLGGSLQELILQGKTIIAGNSEDYKNNYASSILFPFAGRTEDGKYIFQNKEYQLLCNDKENNNALHGLVYDKKFTLVEQAEKNNAISVIIHFEEIEKAKGFPFLYQITLEYTLSNDSLQLKMSVKNNDTNTFPFFLGWHPYFETSNIKHTSVSFQANKKIKYNNRLVPTDFLDVNITKPIMFKEQQFDDCFFLTNNTIDFETPDYKISLESDAKNAYLQMYTPPHRKSVALEPQTGISNSLNNKIGLQNLEPQKEYSINWSIKKHD
ncbi:aldose 1-epimerase [Polaribacter aestuariivivens]|uniref:Aldose 1-epimerase n=1 Tax=Polaribacter aestuariivivens TaxID=2304626 RepID=A0A5S3N5I8_9FLAO|nr:aldose 1-epimerase [Polaribacter aestuariivivens]TMM30585.1 aldose 1-epimerase [Polaribacter aestuariivivens]